MNHPIDTYLLQHQPHIHSLFSKALLQKKWSHAYLLSGKANMPLLETSTFLAQSLLCESPSPLACQTCLSCTRFANGNYTDIHIFNGAESSIKKADVQFLFDQFAITGLEEANKQIYILHRIEFMTPEAINALLKFLEEPNLDIYAILTTQDIEKILPTIISRSQVLSFKPTNILLLINSCENQGVSKEDSQMLAYFFGTEQEIITFSQQPWYLSFKPIIHTFFEAWMSKAEKAKFYARDSLIPLIEDKYQALFLLTWLETFLHQAWMHQLGEPMKMTAYSSIIVGLSLKVKDIPTILNQIIQARVDIAMNVNLSLFLDAFFIQMI